MDHRSRPRGIGLSRVPGTQPRIPRAPVPFHVEQEARGEDEWEVRELPRPRTPTPINRPLQSEEMTDNVMGKDMLPYNPLYHPQKKRGDFLLCPQEIGQETKSRAYIGWDWGEG